ncbi:mas-related G-protein coupled receptor member X1-like [Dipodomys spectabilis]|uniref:mas-related G-protein coupled receptor member X1-like n=1 Tax=Dipodomys spectabilis TaxID=105255 RepID=UPI001C53D07E|nr:mas-related G-protein coupled receptor member X1-like [Dipodomys spectabilis]
MISAHSLPFLTTFHNEEAESSLLSMNRHIEQGGKPDEVRLGSTSGGFVSQDPTSPFQWTEATTVNGTDQFCENHLVLELVNLIIALVGLAGNAVVLWVLGFQMRKNAISVYILNLAVADFLFLICLIITNMLFVIDLSYSFSGPVSAILTNVATIPYITGLSILSAISTERCLSVLWPIWYHCHRPRHMSVVICALLWALSLILNILEWYFSGFLELFYDRKWWENVDFIITSWLFILLIILSVSSLALIVRMFCSSRRLPLTRLYVTILITMMVFLICGLPFGIFWFLLWWLPISFYHNSCYLFPVTLCLCCVNSCANPVIYFFIGSFRQQRQRRTLKLILQRALQDTPDVNDYRGSNSQRTQEELESRRLE